MGEKYAELERPIVAMAMGCQLHQRLLAADLTGQEWPIDDFDPDGAQLRPLVIDGVDYGACSVGLDDTDNDGELRRDIRYLLSERPLPKPPPKPRGRR